MYIDHGKWNRSTSDFEYDERLSSLETPASEMAAGNDPGYAPVSPETPSWGPPVGEDPGYAPISPETPSWGPPSSGSNEPGYAPISPETPSWGPPASGGNGGTNGGTSGGGIGTIRPPVIIVPGVTVTPSLPANRSFNIRFLHAAPSLAAVNVRLGNQTMIQSLQFGNATPYYLETGNQRILITLTSSRNGSVLYRGYFYFAGQAAYTVSIVENSSGSISLYVLTDAPCNRTNYGCLRAVNLSPNSGAVDVFLSGYGRLFRSVSPFSYTGYRMIGQGTYRASVSEALPCTNDNAVIMAEEYVECSNTRIAILDTATVNIMNGVTYTLYIIGTAYQFPSLQILPLESDLIY